MRLALTFLLLCALRLSAVEWPLIGLEIETNGCVVRATISTSPDLGTTAASTNGFFFPGFGTNNHLTSSNALVFTLTTAGHDRTGALITRQQTVYGTRVLRLPVLFNTNDIVAENVTNIVARIALSDYIFAADTAITATAKLGWFSTTNGVATNAAAFSAVAVTNSSTQTHPMAIANWSWPGWQRVTNTTMRLRALAFHQSAQDGYPVECLQFVTRDEGGVIKTNIAVQTVDRSLPDTLPFGEYVADVDCSGFTALHQIRCDIIASPRRGDTNAVLNTMRNVYTGITPLPTSITNLYDPNQAYSDIIAVVDLAAGANPVATNGVATGVSSANYFADVTKAIQGICASNLAIYGHNDGGGATVYIRSGVTNLFGSTAALTMGVPEQGKSWLHIVPYPGHTVTITNQTGGQRTSNATHIAGINLGGASATVVWCSDMPRLWIDNCNINKSGVGALAFSSKTVWVTHCTIPNLGNGSSSGGLRASSTQDTSYFIRGNNLDGLDATICFRVCAGNVQRNMVPTMRIWSDVSSGQPIRADFAIMHGNYFGGLISAATAVVDLGLNQGIGAGMVISSTVFEIATNHVSTIFNICSLNTLSYTNILIVDTCWLGKRIAGVGYNDSGTAPAYRYQWALLNSIWDNTGFKSAEHPTVNSARTGNMPVMYQVGCSGNFYVEADTTGVDAPGSFNPFFDGLNSYHPRSTADLNSETNSAGIVKFVDRRSAGGLYSPIPGNGDYRLKDTSPLHFSRKNQLRIKQVNKFGLGGHTTSAIDPVGPYGAGNGPRKGAMF